jgi:predicted O-linked N-acetylglucosamine transferase (SPINDLY family)
VGFVSRFFCNHTIGRFMRGLMANLSRDRFTVTVFSVGPYDDPVSRLIRQQADDYVVLPHNLPAVRALLAGRQLDVLFYSDIGMDQVTFALAFSRLAPVQCVTWGHPVTTGIPAIDYFLSAQDLEPDDAAGHYSERLVRLKHLPTYYYQPRLTGPARPRAAFGLPADRNLYVCPQTLFKLHPHFDSFLAGILVADPRAHLVFSTSRHKHWRQLLEARLRRTLPGAGERLQFVPPQPHEDFLQLLAAADVILDPIHFGGGNTTYEALALGTPIVTLPGQFMRGRVTYACYRQMGVLDCVARDREDYVRLAVRLAAEPDWRAAVQERIAATRGVLYENSDAVREIEQFLVEAVDAARRRGEA